MEKRLCEALENKPENYILPFFWQHGEARELLEEGMEKIHGAGIGAVCVESRPHPDFLGEKWWQDLGVIMEKARTLGMRVWVLDDAHFPSGFCNGRIGESSPYGKIYLAHYTIDVEGPLRRNAFMVRLEPGERLVGVTLGRRDRERSFHQTQVREVTGLVRDGKLYLDIPKGTWAVTVIKTTHRGTGRKGYINPIDRDSVGFFIDTVYEAHYAHFGKDFGGVFAGFFSDEPEIGNCLGEYKHDSHIGQPDMRLPWGRELEERLRNQWGRDFVPNLLAMWVDVDGTAERDSTVGPGCTAERGSTVEPGGTAEWGSTAEPGCMAERDRTVGTGGTGRQDATVMYNRTGLLRRQFMEQVADLYGECFCTQIGDWCRAHGVEYIGHVIEDGGTHCHLGLGTGHFFKALWGQDMSGIDVVLQQIRPQLDDFPFYSIGGTGFYHGEFFHYGLAKLGVSLGHLDPKKRGRTMCEVFGAYGWAEGLKLMKWLLDHMLVRGVNCFVPHAFTMKEFPDPDCPPHFYARGRNPQYPYFKYLMEYANRVAHLINGGTHVPSVALLYTAEQEWMGGVRKFEKDARELARGQIDFEVVPEEILLKERLVDGRLTVGQESVSALVVPGSQYISEALAEKCGQLAGQGFPVIFTESLPLAVTASGELRELEEYTGEISLTASGQLKDLPGHTGGVCLTEGARLADTLRQRGCCEITCPEPQPWLRFYHYVQPEGEFFLFFTESVAEGLETCLTLPACEGGEWWYDPWENRLEAACRQQDGRLFLSLAPYEMKILYRGAVDRERYGELIDDRSRADFSRRLEIPEDAWALETLASGETAWEREPCALGDLTAHGRKPYFSGTMRYTARFSWEGRKGTAVMLDLGEVYESAQVRINGKEAGVRVAPPYRFDVSRLVEQGDNSVEVLVTNTLAAQQRDYMSMTMQLDPARLFGPVALSGG